MSDDDNINLDEPEPIDPPPGRKIELHEDSGSLALSEALGSVFGVLKFIMIGVIIFFVCSGVFTVEPNEVAVVLRFGKPIGEGDERVKKPGLHFAFPYPIDEIVRIPAGQSHTLRSTTGWYHETPEQRAKGEEPPSQKDLVPGWDGYLLSGDGNIIHAKATLKYRVIDPVKYVFYFSNVTNILRNNLNHALIHAAAEFPAHAALYRESEAFRETVALHFRKMLGQLPMGVQMEPLDVQTSPPLWVKDAFEQVNSEQQTASGKKLDAEAQARETLLLAEGEARIIESSGMIESNRLVTSIAAEAKAFEAQLPQYRRAPLLFKRRIMAETFGVALTNSIDKFFVPSKPDGSPRELRLQLNREPPKPTDRK